MIKKMIFSIFLFQTILCSENKFNAIISKCIESPELISLSNGIIGGTLARLRWEYSHQDLDTKLELMYFGPVFTYIISSLIESITIKSNHATSHVHLSTIPLYFLTFIIEDQAINIAKKIINFSKQKYHTWKKI